MNNLEIYKKYKRFEIPKKKVSFKDICFPKFSDFQIPQKFMGKYFSPHNKDLDQNGILIYHKAGSGKTLLAISICLNNLEFGIKPICVMPASLVNNFYKDLLSPVLNNRYISKSEKLKLDSYEIGGKDYRKLMDELISRIDKDFTILSIHKFVELLSLNKLKLDNKLLIIDEVQNVVSEGGNFYKIIYNSIQSSKNLKIVLMSATPIFDRPVEIALTLNLLKLKNEFPTGVDFNSTFIKLKQSPNGKISYKLKNINKFLNLSHGLVSYFKGAPDYTFPEAIIKYVKCEMSPFQISSYNDVLKNDKMATRSLQESILSLPGNFLLGPRLISNIAFPNKKKGDEGLSSLKGNALSENLYKYSSKFAAILPKLKKHCKTFIYSNFKESGGIKSLVKILEANGYKDYMKHGPGKNRFCTITSDLDLRKREEVRNVANNIKNLKGDYLKIILGSPSLREGISFFGFQQAILIDPNWNISRDIQIIARVVRYCSHKNVPEEERFVKVYILLATLPNKTSIDEYIVSLQQMKYKINKKFENLLQLNAFDCRLFKNANDLKGECY